MANPVLEFLTLETTDSSNRAPALFERFSQAAGISVQGQFERWDSIWQKLLNVGLYRKGADIGEAGTTWLESLVDMNALMPFTTRDVMMMGGQQAFIPSVWNMACLPTKPETWGIPVRSDVRVILYRKDMLEDCGLDPQQAFSSFEQIPTTLSKLTKVTPTPWAVATNEKAMVAIHTIASWIWNAGGDFISPDGKQVLFMEPETLRAITAFFDLYRFMPRSWSLANGDPSEMLRKGEAAVTISGNIPATLAAWRTMPLEEKAKFGVATIPGPCFMGGTVLVIFKHSNQSEKALQFVKYLVSPEVQAEYAPLIGFLPTRQEAWKMPPFSNDPIYQTLYHAFSKGRSLPTVALWGMIEDRLIKEFNAIWRELFTEQHPDTAQVVSKHLGAYARRLGLALGY